MKTFTQGLVDWALISILTIYCLVLLMGCVILGLGQYIKQLFNTLVKGVL